MRRAQYAHNQFIVFAESPCIIRKTDETLAAHTIKHSLTLAHNRWANSNARQRTSAQIHTCRSNGVRTKLIDLFHPTSQTTKTTTTTIKDMLARYTLQSAHNIRFPFQFSDPLAVVIIVIIMYMHILCSSYFFQFFDFILLASCVLVSFHNRTVQHARPSNDETNNEKPHIESKIHCKRSMIYNGQLRAIILHWQMGERWKCAKRWKRRREIICIILLL